MGRMYGGGFLKESLGIGCLVFGQNSGGRSFVFVKGLGFTMEEEDRVRFWFDDQVAVFFMPLVS